MVQDYARPSRREQGKRTAIVCKSLFGKAHTVMAEGGIAASMGNVNSHDGWQVHFRDTMRGGKFFEPLADGRAARQGGSRAGVGARGHGAPFRPDARRPDQPTKFRWPRVSADWPTSATGQVWSSSAPCSRRSCPLQQEDEREFGNAEAMLKVFAECTVTELLKDEGRIAGAVGYWRESGRFIVFDAPAVVLATGGIGKSFKVTSNSWEYTGDGHALAMRAGGSLVNMEFIQFHPTGMVWPPSVKGILVTESVRGDGGVLNNSEGKRFMFDYVPDVFRDQYAHDEAEGDRWYTDPDNNRRPPELLPRDEVARAINSEVKAGRGSPHGGVFLDVSARLPADAIRQKFPSMYHQFKELAGVDITAEPMEVGPTCHYVMGGVEVEPDTGSAVGVHGLFAAGEVAGGMHGSNRLGGNSLSDLLVFGRRAGLGAAHYLDRPRRGRPAVQAEDIDRGRGCAVAPFTASASENPYTLHTELQQTMNDLVGIIRTCRRDVLRSRSACTNSRAEQPR